MRCRASDAAGTRFWRTAGDQADVDTGPLIDAFNKSAERDAFFVELVDWTEPPEPPGDPGEPTSDEQATLPGSGADPHSPRS